MALIFHVAITVCMAILFPYHLLTPRSHRFWTWICDRWFAQARKAAPLNKLLPAP